MPEGTHKIQSPMDVEAWSSLLEGHPGLWFRNYVLQGVTEGFRIGYHGEQSRLQAKGNNLVSAEEHPEVVDKYLTEEIALERVARMGSVQQARQLGIHCSPFRAITKKHRPNKWSLILASLPQTVAV